MVNAAVTNAMKFHNQQLKVLNAAILGANSTEITYVTAEMFKRRIIECTEKNCIDTKKCQVIQSLTNA